MRVIASFFSSRSFPFYRQSIHHDVMENSHEHDSCSAGYRSIAKPRRVYAPKSTKDVTPSTIPADSESSSPDAQYAAYSTVACLFVLLIAAVLNSVINRLEKSRKQEQALIFNELHHRHTAIRGEKNKTTEMRKAIDSLRKKFSEQVDEIHMLQIERYKLLMLRRKRAKQSAHLHMLTKKLSRSPAPSSKRRKNSMEKLARQIRNTNKRVRWTIFTGFSASAFFCTSTFLFPREGV